MEIVERITQQESVYIRAGVRHSLRLIAVVRIPAVKRATVRKVDRVCNQEKEDRTRNSQNGDQTFCIFTFFKVFFSFLYYYATHYLY